MIHFPDVVIKIKESRIITSLYNKPTDGYNYLHYDSCLVDHIKRSIIFRQTLQLKRIFTENNDLKVHVQDLKIWFRKREYPPIREKIEKDLWLTPSDENNTKKVNGVPLIVTYNQGLSQMIRKNFQLLYAAEQVKKVFSAALSVSSWRRRNLKSYLQLWAKYFRKTLFFMWNSTLRENFNFQFLSFSSFLVVLSKAGH